MEITKRRSPAISLVFQDQWPEKGYFNRLKKTKLHEEVKKEMYWEIILSHNNKRYKNKR